jgi:N-acyl-D-aspartate/D-glutamate deacylase
VEFDLVVRGGTVIDGSGRPGAQGDVAVVGGRIVAIGRLDGRGQREIDADGLVVAPGFVDGHTHMDAQVFWDDLGTSSCWHGVTTAVMGNCGYTLAPTRPQDRNRVASNIQRAEDIPEEALIHGLPWNWETFSEYLDAVDSLPKGINYAAAVGHSPLRIWAMGERAFEEAATEDDLVVMERALSDALGAGAAGFTTARNRSHFTSDDRPVASRIAKWEEITRLVGLLARERDGGVFESGGVEEGHDHMTELRRFQALALSTGVEVLASAIDLEALEVIEDTVARGGHMTGLSHCRLPICNMQSFHSKISFDTLGGEWQALRSQPLDQQRKLLEDPQLRARLVHQAHHGEYRPVAQGDPFAPDFDNMWILYSPYLPNPTVGEEARRRGVDPVEVIIDVALERDFDIFFVQGFGKPLPDDDLIRLLRCPHVTMTFSDAGAHLGSVVDASIQTHLLAYWVRERQAFTLEEAIPMITSRPARAWRLHDRGMVAPGYAADITIFDPQTVAPLYPQVLHDLPGGAHRLEQHAQGYMATIVNGEVLTRDGQASETRPGRLLRANHKPPAATQ